MAADRGRLTDALRRAGRTANELVNSLDADSFYEIGDEIGDTKAPDVPIQARWEERRFTARLVTPANRRKLGVIIVGTGLAGASAAATLGVYALFAGLIAHALDPMGVSGACSGIADG